MIQTICPVCESEIEIPDKEIKFASWMRSDTGGKVLVSCPECCRVLVLPDEIPEDPAVLQAWIMDEEDNPDWLMCIPLLNPEEGLLPVGSIDNIGKKVYKAGMGGKPLSKRAYMFTYGINPECALKRMRPEQAPFKVGGN